jgi:hypothetical protein
MRSRVSRLALLSRALTHHDMKSLAPALLSSPPMGVGRRVPSRLWLPGWALLVLLLVNGAGARDGAQASPSARAGKREFATAELKPDQPPIDPRNAEANVRPSSRHTAPIVAGAVLLAVGGVFLPVGWWVVSRSFVRRTRAHREAAIRPGWKEAA